MVGRHKTIPVFVPHRGCPQACLFCDQKAITGQREPMTPERAAAMIDAGARSRQSGDFIEIGFFGGSFTGIPEEEQEALLSLAQQAVADGRADAVRLSTRPDYIDDAVLRRLVSFGVTTVELGAQSMDDEVLRLSRRGHSAAQTAEAAALIRGAGIGLGLQMMPGLPGDTPEKADRTATAFIAMKPQCVRIYPTLVLRETGLCDLYRRGLYEPLSLEEAVEQCARLQRRFSDAQIAVIRMGLLDMEPEAVCAGPYHPAFGELVLSRVCYHRLAEQLEGLRADSVVIRTNPRDVSVVTGQKRDNLKRLSQAFHLKHIDILQDSAVPRGEALALPRHYIT